MKRRIPPETVAKVIKMNEKGFMQWEIAATLGISAMSVCRFLKKHNERVFDILAQDHAAERGRQVRNLVIMFREAMDEWYRSKKDQAKVKIINEKGLGPGGKATERTEKEIRDSLGDPAYLNQAQNILTAIREIMMMSKKADTKDELPVVGENDVTKALEKLNIMARELKRETSRAVHMQAGETAVADIDDDDNDDDE